MKKVLLPLVATIGLVAAGCYTAIAAEGNGQSWQQLNTQQQKEYNERLKNANSEQEREAIRQDAQRQVQEQSRTRENEASVNSHGGKNKGKGQGQGNASTGGKSSPAGSKNKPQKKGH